MMCMKNISMNTANTYQLMVPWMNNASELFECCTSVLYILADAAAIDPVQQVTHHVEYKETTYFGDFLGVSSGRGLLGIIGGVGDAGAGGVVVVGGVVIGGVVVVGGVAGGVVVAGGVGVTGG